MKHFLKILTAGMCFLFALFLFGCAPDTIDFRDYARQNGCDVGAVTSIAVFQDDNNGHLLKYTITDSKTVKEVSAILGSAVLEKQNESTEGDNGYIVLRGDGFELRVSLTQIQIDDTYYLYSNHALFDCIEDAVKDMTPETE